MAQSIFKASVGRFKKYIALMLSFYAEFSKFMKQAESHLWRLFKNIDLDHNNQLSHEELKAAFRSAGITVSDAKLKDFFENMDLNHDGVISFDEWR